MLRFPPWKAGLILLVCLAGIVFSLPNLFPRETMERLPNWLPHEQMNLGLDLQGGAHLLLEVDVGAVLAERLETASDDLRSTLRSERIRYRSAVRGDQIIVTLSDPAQAEQAVDVINDQLNSDILNQTYEINQAANGRIEITMTEAAARSVEEATVQQSLEIVRRRIDEVGTREPNIQRQGSNQILVQVPGESDPEGIKRLLGQTAKLSFHLVDLDTPLSQALSGNLPPGSELMPSAEEGMPQVVVKKRVEVSGENLIDAQPTYQDNRPVVSFRFDSVGARKFGEVTKAHVRELLAIVLDGRVISAPEIQEPILGGSGVISGSFTTQEANELAVLLRAGALPAPLVVVEERTVGPDLGADSIVAGQMAAVIALLAVVVFMVVYYGFFGIVANVALLVNLILMVAVMSLLQATLTLPGIAGIVLTIGMAVDSNVLIFERIHEEVRLGKTPLNAIESGFREATRTIVDANLTTLIAAILLYAFGSGPIRGFAVTLAIGIGSSMFTAIILTRLIIAYWFRRARPVALAI